MSTEEKGYIKGIKRQVCEIWSRVTGYLRPVSNWNKGKREEFKDRQTYKDKIENWSEIWDTSHKVHSEMSVFWNAAYAARWIWRTTIFKFLSNQGVPLKDNLRSISHVNFLNFLLNDKRSEKYEN